MRRSLYAFLVVAAVPAMLVVVPAGHNNVPAHAAAGQQFTWFNQTMTHNVKKYAEPATTAPSDWTSPINYAGGHVYLRLDVLTKPSSLNAAAQVCVWRNSYTEESCSSTRAFTAPGVQWVDLGPTTGWWKKNGAFSWATAFSPTRIMFKDVETGTLLMSGGCGTSCYTGTTSLTQHVPITVHAEAIVVAAGSTLVPPASWTGCPASWSAACVSGGGGANTAPIVEAGPSASGLAGQPIALSGSSTDDGLPNPPGSTTLTWSKVSGPGTATFSAPHAASSNATFSEAGSYVVKLSASDGALTSSDTATVSVTTPSTGTTVALIASSSVPAVADRPLRDHLAGLGYTVTVVDDNRVASTSFASVDLIVISSSVATANIPTSFSSLGVPILSNDAPVSVRIQMGKNAGSAPGTSLNILDPTSPLVAGLSATVKVSTKSVSLTSLTPAPGATPVAKQVGAAKPGLFGIDTGAALTSGTAPARRVGFFLGTNAPANLDADGWKLFDAAVSWAIGPIAPPPPPPEPAPWADAERPFRVSIALAASTVERAASVVDVAIDLATALASAGGTGEVAVPSIRVVEVDASGVVIDDTVDVQFDQTPDSPPGVGSLAVRTEDVTPASHERRFHVYFAPTDATFTPASVPPQVTVSNGSSAGQDSFVIGTPSGTWHYQTAAGGFSSLIDGDGNDWITYSTTAGSAGAYRGIPNLVHPDGYFHPGSTASTTTLVSSGPLKATLVSTAPGGWSVRWDIYPDRAHMQVLQASAPYWFLYEGTPGGQVDAGDLVVRPTGAATPLSEEWSGDLPGPEYVGFADPGEHRSLIAVHHQDDAATDSHRVMENNMTVFGFGRSKLVKSLTGTNNSFTLALIDTDVVANVRAAAVGLHAEFVASVGVAEHQS